MAQPASREARVHTASARRPVHGPAARRWRLGAQGRATRGRTGDAMPGAGMAGRVEREGSAAGERLGRRRRVASGGRRVASSQRACSHLAIQNA